MDGREMRTHNYFIGLTSIAVKIPISESPIIHSVCWMLLKRGTSKGNGNGLLIVNWELGSYCLLVTPYAQSPIPNAQSNLY